MNCNIPNINYPSWITDKTKKFIETEFSSILERKIVVDDLANGEINIRKNIYNKIVEFIQEMFEDVDDYFIEFRMIDSADLCELLYERGYKVDNETEEEPLHRLIQKGNLIMSKQFTRIKDDEDELRLTRKQSKR